MAAAPMRMGLTATPERADGRHADLADLIGPTVFRQEISESRGRTLAAYDVVRIPVKLGDEEQYAYDRASAAVRSFMLRRQEQLRADAGAGRKGTPLHLARPLRRDRQRPGGPAGEKAPTTSRSRSRTGPPRSCACWKTCSACTRASG